jgi:hypothetical protein
MVNNVDDFVTNYWEYFLLLEDEFIGIEKIIPIDDTNNNTFSTNYMKIYFALCSEIDVLFKEFIEYNGWHNFSSSDSNFGKYKEIVQQNLIRFTNEIIVFSGKKEIKPFDSWNSNKKPDWWEDYNNIKHNRTLKINGFESFKKANQENILNAFCALYQLEMYFYKCIIDKTDNKSKLRMPVPQSKRIRIKDWFDNSLLIDNRYILYVEDGMLRFEGEMK